MKDHVLALQITLYGLVQGIGFRPFVAGLAKKWHIDGNVMNNGGAVSIKAYAPSCNLEGFLAALKTEAPEQSQIVHLQVEPLDQEQAPKPDGFLILESDAVETDLVILPPDLPVCDKCLEEMKEPMNRRFLHPFISCTHCGPRYSIMRTVPYDRPTTSMVDYPMCPKCKREYKDRNDRRFHAQTVSCHDCGPYLKLETGGMVYERQAAMDKAIEILIEEGILAVKGIGGYHLVTSPWSDTTVQNLRKLKNREQKPFAVCFPDLESIREYYQVSEGEEALLKSKAHPIVLLKDKVKGSKSFSSYLNQSSRYLGAFLPYTPILVQMTSRMGPLLATSANMTDSPILYSDDSIHSLKSPFLDGILTHNRQIVTGQDDSVAWVINGAPQLIRRARGYTPLPVYTPAIKLNLKGKTVFASGGQLKSSFCFQKGPFAFMSQYMGDLDSEAAYGAYERNYDHMARLLSMKPDLAVCDLHPDYLSTAFTQKLGIELIMVQHHHAHTAAVMAEWGLTEPTIGVSFDGTGYGSDGAIWGGEFLLCEKEHYKRVGHLAYATLLGGDESMKDAGKTALCYLAALDQENILGDERYPVVRAAVKAGVNTHSSSSMGRLFDAVSALLGLSRYNRYEGEAAILLENAAAAALATGQPPYPLQFEIQESDGQILMDPAHVLRSIIDSHQKGISAGSLALGFHMATLQAIADICDIIRDRTGIINVAISGGVFQNKILAEGISQRLQQKGFKVFSGKMAPPNDSGLCLGQAYIGMQTLNNRA